MKKIRITSKLLDPIYRESIHIKHHLMLERAVSSYLFSYRSIQGLIFSLTAPLARRLKK